MTKPSIQELKGKYNGLPVAVLGGSPSLPSDIEGLPPDCVMIGVNQHALLLGVVPDYIVTLAPLKRQKWADIVLLSHVPIISHKLGQSDYDIDIPTFRRGFSGHLAVWLGCYITDSDVIICGMDCYSDEKQYFHDQRSTGVEGFPLENHLKEWGRAWKEIEKPERVAVMSGPLQDIFKPYEHNKR